MNDLLNQQRDMAVLNVSEHKLCSGITFPTRRAIRLEVPPHHRYSISTVKITQNAKRLDNISLSKFALNEVFYTEFCCFISQSFRAKVTRVEGKSDFEEKLLGVTWKEAILN
jgi:hypothetical protein